MDNVPWQVYVDSRFDGLQHEIDRRFLDQEKATTTALASAEKAVEAALAAAQTAVDKAEKSSREWQVASNEWRGAMTDREHTFLTRTEFRAMAGSVLGVLAVVAAIAGVVIAATH